MIVKRIINRMNRKMKMKDNRRKKNKSSKNLRMMTMQVNLKKGMRRRQTI